MNGRPRLGAASPFGGDRYFRQIEAHPRIKMRRIRKRIPGALPVVS
jgi:hypothetical protein